MKINNFSGEYRWLSNFWMAPITIGNWIFPSSEHAYQAAKSRDPQDWFKIASLSTPGQAKRSGQYLNLREDWEAIKLDAMAEIIEAKFEQHPDLKAKLIATGDAELIEGNTWNDTFWGVCRGVGHNHLGKILMTYRERIIK